MDTTAPCGGRVPFKSHSLVFSFILSSGEGGPLAFCVCEILTSNVCFTSTATWYEAPSLFVSRKNLTLIAFTVCSPLFVAGRCSPPATISFFSRITPALEREICGDLGRAWSYVPSIELN